MFGVCNYKRLSAVLSRGRGVPFCTPALQVRVPNEEGPSRSPGRPGVRYRTETQRWPLGPQARAGRARNTAQFPIAHAGVYSPAGVLRLEGAHKCVPRLRPATPWAGCRTVRRLDTVQAWRTGTCGTLLLVGTKLYCLIVLRTWTGIVSHAASEVCNQLHSSSPGQPRYNLPTGSVPYIRTAQTPSRHCSSTTGRMESVQGSKMLKGIGRDRPTRIS